MLVSCWIGRILSAWSNDGKRNSSKAALAGNTRIRCMPCDWPILICWSSSESTVSSDSLRVQCSLGVLNHRIHYSHISRGVMLSNEHGNPVNIADHNHTVLPIPVHLFTIVPSCSSTCSNLVWCWPSQLETLPYCKWAFICFRGREMTRTRRAITSLTGLTGLTCSFSGAPRRAHCGSKRSWSLPVSQIGGVRAVWVETTKGCLYRILFNEGTSPRCATYIIRNEYRQACITYTDYTHL